MVGIIFLVLRIALALSLFAFLGWALWLLWKDLSKSASLSLSSLIPALKLASRADHPSFQFAQQEIMIGRDPACQCHLTDKTISGHHARLYFDLSQWWVEDLQSTNGTFLNEQTVSSPMVLATGDHLRVGQLSFDITIQENPALIEE